MNVESNAGVVAGVQSMLSAGEHPSWIAKQMGHTDPSVLFKKYARWMPEMYPHAGDKIKPKSCK